MQASSSGNYIAEEAFKNSFVQQSHTELENRGGTNIVAGSILLVIWLGLVALAISAS
ncbi:hypothetical protein ACQUFW_02835 [Acinetobacter johnsonii]|uniref:hypothetical protein n=1 Tax=Acinetobacter johnsonii TaxID=40214 RepID=UPI003D16E554